MYIHIFLCMNIYTPRCIVSFEVTLLKILRLYKNKIQQNKKFSQYPPNLFYKICIAFLLYFYFKSDGPQTFKYSSETFF